MAYKYRFQAIRSHKQVHNLPSTQMLHEQHFQQLGIHAVPAVIINDKHLIQGGQPPELFEQALRQVAAQQA